MKLTTEYLKSIRPQTTSPREKYSWNLYRFLRHKDVREKIRVYEGKISDTEPVQYFFAVTKCASPQEDTGNIGIFEFILRTRRNNESIEILSYSNYDFSSMKDVTEKFFEEYQKIGKCAFHEPEHELYIRNTERFEIIDEKTRRCKWCGKIFRLRRILVEQDIWNEE